MTLILTYKIIIMLTYKIVRIFYLAVKDDQSLIIG